MKITKDWMKKHFTCEDGLKDISIRNALGKTPHELFDIYINIRPDWVNYNCGILIEDDIIRLKCVIAMFDTRRRYDSDLSLILTVAKDMAEKGEFYVSEDVNNFFSLNKTNENYLYKAFCGLAAYMIDCVTIKRKDRSKVVGLVSKNISLHLENAYNPTKFDLERKFAFIARSFVEEYFETIK